MEYVRFGSAGVRVSPIALGMGFRGQGSADEAQRVIEHAIDSGVNLIDCANNYGPGDDPRVRGSSEEILARVLKTKRNEVVCVQNPYNLLMRDLEGEMFGLLRDEGLGAMAHSPLAVGLLSGRYAPGAAPPPNSPWGGGGKLEGTLASVLSPKVMAVVDAVREVARERGKTMVQVAMNWVLSHPEITVAISGSDTIDQIDDNLGALGWQLSAEEIETLDQVSSGLEPAEGL